MLIVWASWTSSRSTWALGEERGAPGEALCARARGEARAGRGRAGGCAVPARERAGQAHRRRGHPQPPGGGGPDARCCSGEREWVTVQTGQSANGEIEVVGNLQPGAPVVRTPPTPFVRAKRSPRRQRTPARQVTDRASAGPSNPTHVRRRRFTGRAGSSVLSRPRQSSHGPAGFVTQTPCDDFTGSSPRRHAASTRCADY